MVALNEAQKTMFDSISTRYGLLSHTKGAMIKSIKNKSESNETNRIFWSMFIFSNISIMVHKFLVLVFDRFLLRPRNLDSGRFGVSKTCLNRAPRGHQ